MTKPQNTEESGKSAEFLAQAGKGRPKGAVNKTTALLKDAIIQAAEKAGGKEGMIGYLSEQAEKNPGPFMALLGKVLPMQLTGEDGGAIKIEQEVRENADAVARSIAGLVERARSSSVVGGTQH